ncbi:TetR/AcrR family transcriptional regulator [Thioclava sp. BHET1]|nr:TetR/AcrR family transcriptional regulator [Thioclava sp. BHET1]
MNTPRNSYHSPRKTPRQARSAATYETILAATLEVLLSAGSARLTTTQVAEKAGVSVGTMYQYFPNKQSLLFAVLEQHLDKVVTSIETTCRAHRGATIAIMSDALVEAYLSVKTESVEVSRAIAGLMTELDVTEVLSAVSMRMQKAASGLLASAADARIVDLAEVAYTLRILLTGAMRNVLEYQTSGEEVEILRRQLPYVCRSYISAVSRPTEALG